MVQRTYTLDERSLKKLEAYARNLTVSKSAALRLLINRYCKTRGSKI